MTLVRAVEEAEIRSRLRGLIAGQPRVSASSDGNLPFRE
jgi:hypothetical protein